MGALETTHINPIQDGTGGGRAKSPLPYQFSPETSANVGISTLIFWTFSFNPFAILVQKFQGYT